MQFIEEHRENHNFDSGFEDKSAYITINSIGYFQIDDMSSAEPMKIYRKAGRRDYLLCYVDEGMIRADICGRSYEISEGVFLYPPNNTHYYHSANQSGPLKIYWIHFSGYGISEIMYKSELGDKNVLSTGKSTEIASIFKKIIEEMSLRQHAYEGFAASLAEYLISLVSRLACRNIHEEPTIDKRIFPVLKYIHANFHKDMDLSMLAGMTNLSVSRFSSLFNDCMGVYPKVYITKYRIGKACEMIRNTDFSMCQISNFTGYNDPLYFSRIFKKYTDLSPTSYAGKVRSDIF